jgi:Protein of unknown function (DUF4232)
MGGCRRTRALQGAAVAVTALALAACGSSQTTSSTTSAGSTTSAAGGSTAAAVACPAGGLRLAYAGVQGATGHLELTFALRNGSARPCRLRGYPAARLLGASGQMLPMRVSRGGGFFSDARRPARAVVLAPGATARFGLSFVTNNEYAHAHVCRRASAAQAAVPGSAGRWLRVSLARAPRVAPCGGRLVVSPLY